MYNRNRRFNAGSIMAIVVAFAILAVVGVSILPGCEYINSTISEIKGALVGNSFTCEFYDNSGNQFMNAHGKKINMNSNTVYEYSQNSDGTSSKTATMSSVVTITIDGSQIETCGSTVIFVEDGLKEEVDFKAEELSRIESSANGFGDNTFIANIVNEYKNVFGKGVVVVIQSQLGDPICAFSGNSVYWEVCQDLPKTTKLMIDGKALYIHRANFQIIDKDLLG